MPNRCIPYSQGNTLGRLSDGCLPFIQRKHAQPNYRGLLSFGRRIHSIFTKEILLAKLLKLSAIWQKDAFFAKEASLCQMAEGVFFVKRKCTVEAMELMILEDMEDDLNEEDDMMVTLDDAIGGMNVDIGGDDISAEENTTIEYFSDLF
ncbi:hypothetical protein FNV43_RR27321 [Rhamnella rubrinervis]|uniref:Uncharacterized protein n=1 Tax=Rhamnella rubrinervis TaxID=2594499 RepID=A0A8K0GPK3_9ROSA|nr:hypothetical protein FNV43_RR27321 [Rhamnella rubrinervis]